MDTDESLFDPKNLAYWATCLAIAYLTKCKKGGLPVETKTPSGIKYICIQYQQSPTELASEQRRRSAILKNPRHSAYLKHVEKIYYSLTDIPPEQAALVEKNGCFKFVSIFQLANK